jgi:DNA-binding MarR family transcriptional regulator
MARYSDDTALIVRGVLRLSRRLRSERPEASVSLSALGMLATLQRSGPMPAARLAQAERLQPQSLSRLIAQLDEDGLIKRRPGKVDRRTLILEITEAGRRALSHDMTARREWLEGAMRKMLLPGERATLAHAAVAMLRLADEGAETAAVEKKGEEEEG